MHYNSPLVKVTPSSSCASNAYDDREKEEQKFQTRNMTFSLTKGGRFFFDFGPFTTICWSVLLFHRSKKKKKKILSERERDVAAEKRERVSFLVETSHIYKNHASSHIITTGVLSSSL